MAKLEQNLIPGICDNVLNYKSEGPDEDFLPFKTMYALQGRGLRCHAEPETLHPLWNLTKGAIKRSGLQPAFLKGCLMSQVDSGPFSSGGNKMSKEEAIEWLVRRMTTDQFSRLQEDMAADRIGGSSLAPKHDDFDDDEIRDLHSFPTPATKEDLLREKAFTTRGMFALTLIYFSLDSWPAIDNRSAN